MTSLSAEHGLTTTAPSRGRVGMALLIFMESVFFSGFIVTYLFYIGRSAFGPQPAQVLELGPVLLNSACLLSSSVSVWLAVRALRRGSLTGFRIWMTVTVLLGLEFLVGTALEWRGLYLEHGLTLRTNIFGSNFYALVGFHAFHVCIGLLLLGGSLLFSFLGWIRPERDAERIDVVTWYWHFVDVVWILVFTVVYILGRSTTEIV